MELGKNIREAIRSGPMPLGRISEGKEDYMVGDPPWGVSGSDHILGVPVLVSNTGKMSRLGLLECYWD